MCFCNTYPDNVPCYDCEHGISSVAKYKEHDIFWDKKDRVFYIDSEHSTTYNTDIDKLKKIIDDTHNSNSRKIPKRKLERKG